MKLLKKLTAGALCLTLALTMATGAAAAQPGENAADALARLGVLQGRTEEGDLALDQDVTRAEAATILYRIVTGDVTGDGLTAPKTDPFTDVKKGDWHAAAVSWCAERGLIGGHGGGVFAPNDSVTGQQLTAMLLRALNYDDGDSFTGGDWAESTTDFAALTGITDGIAAAALTGPADRDLVARLTYQAIARTPLARPDGSNAPAGTTLGYRSFRWVDGSPVEDIVPLTVGDWFYVLDATPIKYVDTHDVLLAVAGGRVAPVETIKGLAVAAADKGGMAGQTGLYKVEELENGRVSMVSSLPAHTDITYRAPGVLSAVDEDGNAVYLTMADGCRAYQLDLEAGTLAPVVIEDIKDADGCVAARDAHGYAAVLYLIG